MASVISCPRCGSEISNNSICFQCGEVVAEPSPSQDPFLGRRIADKYLIESVLGSGAMGCVYRAEHIALKRKVAIKILHSHLARDPSLIQRFMREARAASRLSHANIVTLLDFGQETKDGLLYLVMEFIKGRSLRQVMEEENPLEFTRLMHLAKQILLAIDEAHAHGIVHRDLKPDNIIVLPTRRGKEMVKVVDFGLAQIIGTEDPRLTATGLIFGTPSYLSPEQARAGDVVPASDIYSFGVILYELVTGTLPFTASNVFDLVNKHLTEIPLHPALKAPERNISNELAAIILRCLEKKPKQRFANAIEIHDALIATTESDQIAAGIAPSTITAPKPGLAQTFPYPDPDAVITKPLAQESLSAATAGTPLLAAMSCRACGQPVSPGVKFCGSCGMPTGTVSGACPACGTICQPNERFCTSCGAVLTASLQTGMVAGGPTFSPAASSCPACGEPLTALESTCSRCGTPNLASIQEQTLEHLKEYMPSGVINAILQTRADLSTQRRNVTILFADVSGFAGLSENRDPEEVVRLMNLCFEGLVEAVHRYGGVVDKFIGDCVMAVFGAPTAHEDDPERALRAAFDMLASLETINRTFPKRLSLRIGINTGPVVAGAVGGASSKLNYTVIGDTVNVAQYLEEAADAGKILVSETVFQTCRKIARFKALPHFQPKDRKQRVAPFVAESLVHDVDQPVSTVTVLIGRISERKVIEEAGVLTLKGRGSAILLTGEPGIGKTALLNHAAEMLRQMGIKTHLVHPRPHDVGSRALLELLRSFLGCGAEANTNEIRLKLAERASMGLDVTDQQVLSHLMSNGEERVTLPPDILDMASTTAMRRILRAQASMAPTAVLIDDVRNLSGRERAILLATADVTRHAALLLIVTDRQESLRLWSHENFRRIDIGPLHAQDAQRFLHKLAEGRPIHPNTAQHLLDAAGGNPLYLVEMARALDDKGQLAILKPRERGGLTGTALSEGLRQIVLARFDGMEPDMKRALIYAAVIGRSFTLGLLSRLTGNAHALAGTLEKLVEQGILEYDPGGGVVRLKFRHDMVREALYELITHKTQKTIHHDVANLLLAHAGGDTNPLEIAQHLEKCGRDAEAADLFERAGNECITRSEWTEAAQALGRAVAALERAQAVGMIRRQDNSQRTLAIKLKLSQALNQSSQWEEAQKVALEVHDLALQFGEPVLSARAARQLGRAISETGKLSEADSILDEAYRTALQCGDLDLAADLASDLGEVRERAGDLRGAMTILVGALDMLEAAVKRSKVTQMAASAARVAEVLNRLGRVSLRFKKTKEALSYWQAALRQATAGQDHVLAARIQGNIGNAQAILGDKGNAMRTLKQALQASQSLGDRLGVAKLLYNLARLYVETGNGEQAAAFARESFDLSVEIGWREGEAIGASMLEQLTGGGGY